MAKGKQQDHPRDNNTTLKWTHAQCVTTNARSTRPRIAHIPKNPEQSTSIARGLGGYI
jgi:hypothetical protein